MDISQLIASPYLVPFDEQFDVRQAPTIPTGKVPDNKQYKKRLKRLVKELDELQQTMFAHNHHALLLVFQAMDVAGKDSTIRAVTTGINPAGCRVHAFKEPNSTELDHDFLWRTNRNLPERGQIGIFNRSYYEEVLVVRVHPELLDNQRLPAEKPNELLWKQRFQSINDMEKHLAHNGTVVLKFWLNVSKDEQKKRFLSRLNNPKKHWKFSEADIDQRQHWDAYMTAYQAMLRETSKPHAPWFAIPADNKLYMRLQVAEIILQTLRGLDLEYPSVDIEEQRRFESYRQRLNQEY
jgi:PPK2 family polyphosphate:nucleotide phosphotransferase